MDFLWVLVFLLEITKYLLMGNIFFEIKAKRYWMVAVTALVYLGVVCFGSFTIDGFPILTVFFVIIVLLFMMDIRIQKKITGIIKIIFLASCMDGIAGISLELFIGNKYNDSAIHVIINNIVTISVILCDNERITPSFD